MAVLSDVIQSGTRSAQPAASSVGAGTLYRVADEGGALERSTGSTWENAGGAAWVDYVPTWISAGNGAQPDLGNGELIARYRAVPAGGGEYTVDVALSFTFGSTTAFGEPGEPWAIGLPPVGTTGNAGVSVGHMVLFCAGASPPVQFGLMVPSGTVLDLLTSTGAVVGASSPGVWADWDFFVAQCRYETVGAPG
jgi:hypothetical protein